MSFQQKLYRSANYMFLFLIDSWKILKILKYKILFFLILNQYKLINVSINFGSGKSGHYIAFCRTDDSQFYSFNDSFISLKNFNKIKNSIPYIFIYKNVEKSGKTKEIELKSIFKIVRIYLADFFKVINTKYECDFEEKYRNNKIIWEDVYNSYELTINF